MSNNYRDNHDDQLALRNALSGYFATVTIHHQRTYRSAHPSACPRYTYEKFKPVFDEFFKLVNDVKSHQIHVRRLAKLMNDFTEMLISSASFTQKDLSAFWPEADNSDTTIRIHSARLKRMGARTLSAIVEDAAASRQKPHRPRATEQGATNRRDALAPTPSKAPTAQTALRRIPKPPRGAAAPRL